MEEDCKLKGRSDILIKTNKNFLKGRVNFGHVRGFPRVALRRFCLEGLPFCLDGISFSCFIASQLWLYYLFLIYCLLERGSLMPFSLLPWAFYSHSSPLAFSVSFYVYHKLLKVVGDFFSAKNRKGGWFWRSSLVEDLTHKWGDFWYLYLPIKPRKQIVRKKHPLIQKILYHKIESVQTISSFTNRDERKLEV